MASGEQNLLLSRRVYDVLKFVAQILLPAIGTLYFTLAQTWHWAHGPEVVGTITAIDLFLGVVLGFSSRHYYKSGANFDGEVNVFPEDGGNKVQFAFNAPPEDLVDEPGKHSIEFRVQHKAQEAKIPNSRGPARGPVGRAGQSPRAE